MELLWCPPRRGALWGKWLHTMAPSSLRLFSLWDWDVSGLAPSMTRWEGWALYLYCTLCVAFQTSLCQTLITWLQWVPISSLSSLRLSHFSPSLSHPHSLLIFPPPHPALAYIFILTFLFCSNPRFSRIKRGWASSGHRKQVTTTVLVDLEDHLKMGIGFLNHPGTLCWYN